MRGLGGRNQFLDYSPAQLHAVVEYLGCFVQQLCV